MHSKPWITFNKPVVLKKVHLQIMNSSFGPFSKAPISEQYKHQPALQSRNNTSWPTATK